MAQGQYTYKLDVENSRALRKLAEFAKASDKATQRIVKDANKTKKSNSEIRKTLLDLKREYDSLQKKATATAKVDEKATAKAKVDEEATAQAKSRWKLLHGR